MKRARAALGLLVALGACAPRAADTLTVAVALLPSELPVYRAVTAEFERSRGLRVVLVPQQYPEIRRALAAEAQAGSGTLDVVELDVYALPLAAADTVRLTPEEVGPLAGALAPEALAAGVHDGQRFLPHRLAWQALLYDHTALPRPPADWAELVAAARAHPGQVGLKGARYEGLTCDVLPFVWSAGGSGVVLDDAGGRAALRLMATLAPFLHPQSATFREATLVEAMARGELVLALGWPSQVALLASLGRSPEPIRSAPLPRGPAGRTTVLGGGFLALARRTPHRAAAVDFVRFVLSRPVQERLARELGWLSPRRDVASIPDDARYGGFVAMADDVRPRPLRRDYPAISRRWQRAVRAVAFGGADPDAVAAAAAAAGGS